MMDVLQNAISRWGAQFLREFDKAFDRAFAQAMRKQFGPDWKGNKTMQTDTQQTQETTEVQNTTQTTTTQEKKPLGERIVAIVSEYNQKGAKVMFAQIRDRLGNVKSGVLDKELQRQRRRGALTYTQKHGWKIAETPTDN